MANLLVVDDDKNQGQLYKMDLEDDGPHGGTPLPAKAVPKGPRIAQASSTGPT